MSYSSKVSRRGIAPIDIDLSRAIFNIKRRVLFNVDEHTSSGATLANAIAASTSGSPSTSPNHSINYPVNNSTRPLMTTPISTKNDGTHNTPITSSPSKASPSPIEILFNPYTTTRRSEQSTTANAIEIHTESTASDDPFTQLVNRTTEGLRYHPPELCDEGENGTYFLRDKNGKRIAVFKCADEEGVSSPKRKINPPSLYSNPEDDEYFKQFHLEIAGESDLQASDASNMDQMITDCVKNEVAPYIPIFKPKDSIRFLRLDWLPFIHRHHHRPLVPTRRIPPSTSPPPKLDPFRSLWTVMELPPTLDPSSSQ